MYHNLLYSILLAIKYNILLAILFTVIAYNLLVKWHGFSGITCQNILKFPN